MAYFKPTPEIREVPVNPPETALLFIDVQNYNCHPQGAALSDELPGRDTLLERIEDTKPRLTALQQGCRDAGIEVMYTIIQSLTKDGRDRSLDYKLSGFHVPPGSWDAQMLDCIAPDVDEIVIPKTSSSVFQSTNIDYVLRSMGKKYLILAGALTDQCVGHAVRDACDLGYLVTLIPDCCITWTEERQANELSCNAGYCRQRTMQQLITELQEYAKLRKT